MAETRIDYHWDTDLFIAALGFKGGTCLSKIHADFFRLSEDLDFSLSTPTEASRSQCSRSLNGFNARFAALPNRCDCFRIDQKLRGFNNSLQYGARRLPPDSNVIPRFNVPHASSNMRAGTYQYAANLFQM